MSIAEKLQTIAENAPKVFEAGKKSQWDEFWDDFQLNGERRTYYYAFFSRWQFGSWSDVTFKPKYPIICDGSARGSDGDAARNMLGQCKLITKIEQEIVVRNSYFVGVFANCEKLHTIENLTVENITLVENPFSYCTDLVNLNIKGEIAVNGFNWQWSTKLNKESIQKIIGILSNTTSGLTVTLSKTAVNNAFTDAEWNTLIATKPNWNISLV